MISVNVFKVSMGIEFKKVFIPGDYAAVDADTRAMKT